MVCGGGESGDEVYGLPVISVLKAQGHVLFFNESP